MLEDLIGTLKKDEANWERFRNCLVERDIPPRTVLLSEGEVANRVYFIKKGCLRIWFNKDGKDITLQFFFEGQAVASIDSFLSNQPSRFFIQSIEPSTVVSIGKDDFTQLKKCYPEIEKRFQQLLFQRFGNYANIFLSRIKDTPRPLFV
jgi:CRP-like cAMP-binding protein